ncbi:MAG: GNAT family N-acetyltransferase [Fibrobacteria bacterium]|nr:GNAT family N-acetyltransferase [Fibrobacteria bacterium]
MDIQFKQIKHFDQDQLRDLFLSVGWSSGQYPDQLVVAMENSHRVISAWDGDRLVGLVNALSDGIMTAYFHYLLVHPDYHDRGIGKNLATLILGEYEGFARKVLIAYEEEVPFYEKLGFVVGSGKTPMFVTHLTT